MGAMPAVTLTLTEAATLLDPPMTKRQLRRAITQAGLQPSGSRYTGRAGRPELRYDATALLRIHATWANTRQPA
jgi:hypothetical protein